MHHISLHTSVSFNTITSSLAEYYGLLLLKNTLKWNVQLLTYLMHSHFSSQCVSVSYFFAYTFKTGSPSTIGCCLHNTSKWNVQILTVLHSRLFITVGKCIIFPCIHLSILIRLQVPRVLLAAASIIHRNGMQLLTYLMHSHLFATGCKCIIVLHVHVCQNDYRFPGRVLLIAACRIHRNGMCKY